MSDAQELRGSYDSNEAEADGRREKKKSYYIEDAVRGSDRTDRHQRSRRFIYLPLIVILIVIGTIAGLISWYYLSMEEDEIEFDKFSSSSSSDGGIENNNHYEHDSSYQKREIVKNHTSSYSSYEINNRYRLNSSFDEDYSINFTTTTLTQLSTPEYIMDNSNSKEMIDINNNIVEGAGKLDSNHETFFGNLFMGMANKPYDERRFNRVRGIYRSMNTKLTSTFETLQDNGGFVCFPDTNIEFNLAVNSSECCIVYLTRSRDDPSYVIESEVYLSSRKVIMGNPALMPIIEPAKGVHRNFRVLKGGLLDLRFVTLRGGGAIPVGDNTGLVFGSSIIQEYGGEIRLQGVLFSNPLQTYEKYVEALQDPVIKRSMGGSIITVGGTPTMIGCTIFGYLPYGDPSLNKVGIGGFALHFGGIVTEIATVRISYNLWGNIIVVGGYRAIFHGAYDGWAVIEIGIGPLAAQQGIGIQFYVSSGIMTMVGLTRTTGHFLIERAGMGLFTTNAGVMSFIGYEQHLARFGRAFFNIGGKFHNSVGILNVIGLLQVAVHFITQQSSVGGLILNGAGVYIEVGLLRVSTTFIDSSAYIGGRLYQGGGLVISIGDLQILSRFINVAFAVGGVHFCLGGLIIKIGWGQWGAAAIVFQRSYGAGFFIVGGLLVSIGWRFNAAVWIRNNKGNLIEISNNVYVVRERERRLSIGDDGILTTFETPRKAIRELRKLARNKGYPSSYKRIDRMLEEEKRDDSSSSILSWIEKKVDQEIKEVSSSTISSTLIPVNYSPDDTIIGKDLIIKIPSDTGENNPLKFESKIHTLSPTRVVIYNVTTNISPDCDDTLEKSGSKMECDGSLINGDIDQDKCTICTNGLKNEISESLIEKCPPSSTCDFFDNPLNHNYLIESNFVIPDNTRLFQQYSSILSKTSASRIKSRLTSNIDKNFENSWNHLQNNMPPPEIENNDITEDDIYTSDGSYQKNKNYYFKNYRDHIQEGNITFYFHPSYSSQYGGAGLPASVIKNAIYLYFGTDKGYSLSVTEANKFDEIFTNPESYDLFRKASEVEPEILKPLIPREYFLDQEQPTLASCLSPSAYEISAMSQEKSLSNAVGKQTFSFYLSTFDKELNNYLKEQIHLLTNSEGQEYVGLVKEILLAESQSKSDNTIDEDEIETLRLNLCQNSRFNIKYEKIMGKRRKVENGGKNAKAFIENLRTKSQRAKVFTDDETISIDAIENDAMDVEKVDVSAYTGLEENKSFLSPVIHIASIENSALPASTITMGETYQIAFLYFPENSKIQLFLMHEDESFIPISHEATVFVMNNGKRSDDENEERVVTQLTWVAPILKEEGSYFFRAIDFANPGLFTYSTMFEITKG